jgi:serine/threonine protein kinase
MNATGIELSPGAMFARFRVERVLGRGGMGVVYLAADPWLSRRVALKLIAPELCAHAGFRERFLQESRLAASLDHSHVIPVYEAGEAGGQLYIAMRYVEGRDLGTLLAEEGPLDPGRAIALCEQVGQALDAAHALGLVHRDVKPANVLVTLEDGEEHCYLGDFGLARSGGAQLSAHPHLSGTADYTAPEQIAGQATDSRTDLYSLACVLYECMAGKPPFAAPRASATLFGHLNEPPPSLHAHRPELPDQIDTVLATALAKDPDQRHPNCRELCQAAQQALGLTGTSRFSRRQLLVATAGASLAIAAAVSVPTILLTRNPRRPAALGPRSVLPLKRSAVVRIDPRTSRLATAAHTGSSPELVAAGGGGVWAIDGADRSLWRMSAAGDDSVRIGTPAEPLRPQALVVGDGRVWIGYTEAATRTSIWRHAVGSGGFAKAVPALGGCTNVPLALADGSLWWMGPVNQWDTHDKLVRIRPATGEVIGTIDDFPQSRSGGGAFAFGHGEAWISNYEAAGPPFVFRMDLETKRRIATVQLESRGGELVFGEGSTWLVSPDTDSLLRIDSATNEIADTVRVGRAPEHIAFGNGSVWVTSSRDGTLTRVDTRTLDVSTVEVGGNPAGIAAGSGAIWVAVSV